MGHIELIVSALLLLSPVVLSRHDDDFAFDNSEEFQVELHVNHSEIENNGLKRLWGVPDTSAYVGHLFRMEIPKEAFSGDVLSYKVRTENGHHLPSWLAVDSKHGLLSGLPQHQDLGVHRFTVTAHGRTQGHTATDTFTIEVKRADEKPHSKYGSCAVGASRLVLALLLDTPMHNVAPRQRIRALMDLSNFMALDGDEFWMEPYKPSPSATMLLSGVGNTRRRRGDATTAICFNVGCADKLWSRHKVLVAGLREQARDGTLSHTLRLPVLGWRLEAHKPAPRPKRQSPLADGSGDYENYDGDYSGYGDDEDEEFDEDLDPEHVDPPSVPLSTTTSHPHRHHHGETLGYSAPQFTTDVFQTETTSTTTTTTLSPTTSATTSTQPPPPTSPPTEPPTSPPTTEEATTAEETTPESTSTNSYTTEDDKVEITPYESSPAESSNTNFSIATPLPTVPRKFNHSPVIIVPEDVTTIEPESQTVMIRPSYELPAVSSSVPPSPPIMTSSSTEPSPSVETWPSETTSEISTEMSSSTVLTSPIILTSSTMLTSPPTTPQLTTSSSTPNPTTTPQTESTIQEVTQTDFGSPTESSSTIIGRTTETVTFPIPVNQPPILKHHMKKLAIIAGKAFRYLIPANLFTDPEEGSNLTFTMYDAENMKLSPSSWIQFIPHDQEVYGLPLESHVSRWNFAVEAQDSEGLVARGPLDITVQQHKGGRTINHQFILQFKLNKNYTNAIDWQIRALEGIVTLFRDTDMEQLTVLNATQVGDMCEFVWTNDTVPKDAACPMDDINRLMKIMESETERGSPSANLVRAMSPELKVSGVSWRGVGRCTHTVPATAAADIYPPVTRNQVDHLTATVGHLLVYKVPEDTFFDPEDGGTRQLSLSLRYSDRSELPAGHWLQFDEKNQEFYGLPGPGDVGSVNYQLIAVDSSKKSAYDSLVVEVVKAPTIRPTVEFQMTMEYPFPMLAYNANNKRKIVEKLAALFGQAETQNVRIDSITDRPTTIIWYNTSLPMDRCPKKEIEELRKMIISDERGSMLGALKENVDHVFDKDLKVMSIRLIPLGLCADQNTKIPKVNTPVHSSNVPSKPGTSEGSYTEYLVTFIIPAVVVVCMILVAGIIACVLYRRRRTGKMSVGDEEECQAFRPKGIPVIFQDELERDDTGPVHKSPVIMREEKPPLLPPTPEYRSGEDAPYRPPPPFAASRSPPRPAKATPTYRKPPPYVPP